MKLSIPEYVDKIRGCYLGKNAGGTLGAPFEGYRGVVDLDYYTQDMSNGVWPNDDLDLQLIWLKACERYGKNVDSNILGEYWLSYIFANWSEYGMGKTNMKNGILPPLSGSYRNLNKNSCGAFIRSEIWACLMPGHPELAIKYAFEDAIVDHADEGVYGEIFFAAVQSAAFCEKDKRKLIKIGLQYIPDECGISLGIKTAINCYDNGVSWKEARRTILKTVPGTFGMYHGYKVIEPEEDIPVGEPGYDAPSNVALTVMAWLYGENDFEKSICIAAGCMEDADCTAATIGALLGIIIGEKGLPSKWIDPIGDGIKTISCNTVEGLSVPQNVTDLCNLLLHLMPVFMPGSLDMLSENIPFIYLNDDHFCKKIELIGSRYALNFGDYIKDHDKSFYKENAIIGAKLICHDGIDVYEEKTLNFTLELENKLGRQQTISATWHLPNEWSILGGKKQAISLECFPGHSRIKYDVQITPRNIDTDSYNILLEIESKGRISRIYIPIVLLNTPNYTGCFKSIK